MDDRMHFLRFQELTGVGADPSALGLSVPTMLLHIIQVASFGPNPGRATTLELALGLASVLVRYVLLVVDNIRLLQWRGKVSPNA